MPTYTKPTKHPEFCRTGDVVEPSSGKKDAGWLYTEKPPRQYFNWLHRLTYQWTQWIEQQFFGMVNLLDYGADPTGVASSDAALTAALAASKNVFVPAGTYLTSAAHNIPEGGILWGVGLESKFNCQGTGAHIGYTGSGTVRDLTFLGDVAKTGQVAVVMGSSANDKQTFIRGCFFNACATGITSASSGLRREHAISDCHLQYCTTGIYASNGDMLVDHITAKLCTKPFHFDAYDHNVHAVISDSKLQDGTMHFVLAKAIQIVNCMLGIDTWTFDRALGVDIMDCISIVGYANALTAGAGLNESCFRFLRCRNYEGYAVVFNDDGLEALDGGQAEITLTGTKTMNAADNLVISTANSFSLAESSKTPHNASQTVRDFIDIATGRIYARTGCRQVTVNLRLFMNLGSVSKDDVTVMISSSDTGAVEFIVPVVLYQSGSTYWATGSFQMLLKYGSYLDVAVKNSGSASITVNTDSRIQVWNV